MDSKDSKPSQQPLICPGHQRPVVQLCYSGITPDGYFLVSASKDGLPMLRNGLTGDWVGTFKGHKGAVWSSTIDSTAHIAATGSADFTARIWDAINGVEKFCMPHPHIVRSVKFNESGNKLITAAQDKKIRTLDLTQAEPSNSTVFSLDGIPYAIDIGGHDMYMFSSCQDKPGVQVWDTRTHQVVSTIETEGKQPSIEINRDSNMVVVACGKQVVFWELDKFQVLKSMELPHQINCAAYSAAKRRVVAGGEDMWLRAFEFDSGEQVECVKGHHGPVHAIVFAPDDEVYASGSEDGTVRIWQTDYHLKENENGGNVAALPSAAAGLAVA